MHGVGLRPCRKGGVRVEAEWMRMYIFFLKKNEILIEHDVPILLSSDYIILFFSF